MRRSDHATQKKYKLTSEYITNRRKCYTFSIIVVGMRHDQIREAWYPNCLYNGQPIDPQPTNFSGFREMHIDAQHDGNTIEGLCSAFTV